MSSKVIALKETSKHITEFFSLKKDARVGGRGKSPHRQVLARGGCSIIASSDCSAFITIVKQLLNACLCNRSGACKAK